MARKHKGLTTFQLKIVGLVMVALSCVARVAFPEGLAGMTKDNVNMSDLSIAMVCEIISWMAVPIYAWLCYQGYRHTRNVWVYAGRLLLLAVIAEVPYDLATSGTAVDWSSQNPVFALAIGVIALGLIDSFKDYSRLIYGVVTFVVVIAAVLWTFFGRIDVRQQIMFGGVLIVLLMVLFRLLENRENTMMLTAALLSSCFCIAPGFGMAVVWYHNRKLGYPQPWCKWLFYVLYPAVLLAFAFI